MLSFRVFVILSAMSSGVWSSAIPMWEYLSKDEKMSYLYSMFESQVGKFCEKNAIMQNCHGELLKYGVDKLKEMPEDHLDTMDPSQRDAHDIIWGSMMEGHEMMKTSRPSSSSSTTTKPNSYEDDSFYDYGLPSAKIENVYRVPPPKGFVFEVSSGQPLYTYPQNFQYVPKAAKDGVYSRFQQQYPVTTTQRAVLGGPMVVKVYPDGRPVYERDHQVPEDDDLRQYQLSKVKIPSF